MLEAQSQAVTFMLEERPGVIDLPQTAAKIPGSLSSRP
jgi:hypothetical protein